MLRTARLDLIPATPAMLNAELEGNEVFARALGVEVPDNWPPVLYDHGAIQWTLRMLDEVPEMAGWATHYIVERRDVPVVIGTAGYKGPPGADATVEIGYGLLEQYRGHGYATEATRALIDRAFADPRVQRVTAQTYPHLSASINVMQRCGLSYRGETEEAGVIEFQLTREDYERLWQSDS
jgi:[ribosomal protein S5]-alanine N-acetyltransferase